MRGRWVVLLVIFIFQFTIFNPEISAQEKNISVTATVKPSNLWKEAISQYSLVTLETQSPELLKPLKISILSKGLLDQIIPEQKIKIHIYRESTLLQEVELLSSQDGTTGFAFVPKEYGNYSVKVENITYDKPISLSPVEFSIQKNQSLLDVIMNIFQPKS